MHVSLVYICVIYCIHNMYVCCWHPCFVYCVLICTVHVFHSFVHICYIIVLMLTTSLCVQLTVCCSFTIHIDNAHHLDAYVTYCASQLSSLSVVKVCKMFALCYLCIFNGTQKLLCFTYHSSPTTSVCVDLT